MNTLRAPFLAAAFAGLLAASGANAATLNQADMPGGVFGPSWDQPTPVDAGYDVIKGVGAQNQYANFVFALPAGPQQLAIDFTAPEGIGPSYSAGGSVLFSEAPFLHGWDGSQLGTFHLSPWQPTQSLALDLAEGFGGSLYLALNFTYGADIAYTISAPSNAVPAPSVVPVPAGIVLIGTAIGALAFVQRRRRTPA